MNRTQVQTGGSTQRLLFSTEILFLELAVAREFRQKAPRFCPVQVKQIAVDLLDIVENRTYDRREAQAIANGEFDGSLNVAQELYFILFHGTGKVLAETVGQFSSFFIHDT